MARRAGTRKPDPYEQAFLAARSIVVDHPFFRYMRASGLGRSMSIRWVEDGAMIAARAWAVVQHSGDILANSHARGSVDEWVWVLTHCALHLGFDHLGPGVPDAGDRDGYSDAAACLVVTRFQQQLRLGTPPVEVPTDLPATDQPRLAQLWRDTAMPAGFAGLGCGGSESDLRHQPLTTARSELTCPPASAPVPARPPAPAWSELFAVGLSAAATSAVETASDARHRAPGRIDPNNDWEKARRWFVSSYPLLGALAAGFTIVSDAELARSWQISVAAVDAGAGEIYVNPLRRLALDECRFVLAHEMLHAALRHGERVAHRDPFLWNIATDFVINGWLVEMGVGTMPSDVLYDPTLKGMSSEEVYDEITKNLRRFRKLATLRGRGLGDMLDHATPSGDEAARAGDLDEFYRRALIGGLAYHQGSGRGLLPSGLVAEVRVLEHPPLPWDVQLARWFDHHFTPLTRQRSYARPSRRQASSPGIPRAGWHRPEEVERRQTFGVVLDTSGSMSHQLLGKALGAVASYALARDVPAARVVFCDAAAYDAGYLPVEEIAGRVMVRGRGGTVLQPGVRLLENAADFPATAPILIITDAECDVVRVRREHAFLVPVGARLPFTPRGDVFRMR